MLSSQNLSTRKSFEEDGFVVVPGILSADDCEMIAAEIAPVVATSAGTRFLLTQPWCAALAGRLRDHPVLSDLIPPEWVAVQCTYFEKSATRNWLVPIHQDLSIPVAERVDALGLQGWSEKEGALLVQGPVAILEQLAAIRMHLDSCEANDGPLKLVPGSHRLGRIDSETFASVRTANGEVTCLAEPGTALVMRPLLLHASSKSTGVSRRRVLHFVFGPRLLPDSLRWRHQV